MQQKCKILLYYSLCGYLQFWVANPKSDHKSATVCSLISCKILMVRQMSENCQGLQLYGHYAHELQKVSIELPWFAVLATDRKTANVII